MKMLSLMVVCAVLLLSCNKDDSDGGAVCQLSASNLTGRYLLKSLKRNGEEKYADTLENPICERDDIYVINPDKTWNVEAGTDTCYIPRNETSGIWEISGDTLYVFNETCIVKQFSCSGFTIEYGILDSINPDRNLIFEETYQKQ